MEFSDVKIGHKTIIEECELVMVLDVYVEPTITRSAE